MSHFYNEAIAHLQVYDFENLSNQKLGLPDLVSCDDMLVGLGADDLRTLMSMWVDHEISRERKAVERTKQ